MNIKNIFLKICAFELILTENSPALLTDEWKVMDEHERVNTPEERAVGKGNKIYLGPNSPTLNKTLTEA